MKVMKTFFLLHLHTKYVLVQCSQGSQAMETEGAEMLESLLPSKFRYRVKEVKILEKSEILEEVRFHASFDINICRKAEVEELFLFIAAKNGTDMKAPRKEKVWMGFSSNRFNCGRSPIPFVLSLIHI